VIPPATNFGSPPGTADMQARKLPHPAADRIDLSVTVPVYGCPEALPALHARVAGVAEQLGLAFELVLVDDLCPRGSWAVAVALAARDPRVRPFQLSRNFGQQAAITAGLSLARGRRVAVLDCDLQDPPELLAALWEKAEQGFEVVLGRRVAKRQSHVRRRLGELYFRLLSRFNDTRIDPTTGSFSLLDREVVDAFLRIGDVSRHYGLILRWLGFKTAYVDYTSDDRFAGSGSYSLGRLLQLALDGMLFQTTVFLRWLVGLGFTFAAAGLAFAAFLVWRALAATALPGWTSLAVLILVTGGAVIVSLGVVGIYVGKIFEQVRSRPIFLVARHAVGGIEAPGLPSGDVPAADQRALREVG